MTTRTMPILAVVGAIVIGIAMLAGWDLRRLIEMSEPKTLMGFKVVTDDLMPKDLIELRDGDGKLIVAFSLRTSQPLTERHPPLSNP